MKMSDSLQNSHCQGAEERAALDGALNALGLDKKITYYSTYAVLKQKVSKIPHAVLGVDVDASQPEIRAAFKRKVMRFHPDKNYGATERESSINKVVYEFVTEAWGELKEPEKRGGWIAMAGLVKKVALVKLV